MDTLVIGAGMSGLRTAMLLADAGHRVTVVDKGRRHGGRMATRRVDDAVFDTGVLDFAVSSRRLGMELDAVARAGHAAMIRDSDSASEAAPRWRGTPTMRSLPTAMARRTTVGHGTDDQARTPVSVHLATTVTALAVRDGRWIVSLTDDGAAGERTADALVLTAPAPQSIALLRTGGHLVSDVTLSQLESVTYAPCLTVLARPIDRTLRATPRSVNAGVADLARLHHNERTDASPVVALTLQASALFSDQHLDGDRDAAAERLAEQASELVGTPLEVVHVHGWRYAHVTRGVDLPALRDDASGAPLVLAGDLFGTNSELPTSTEPEGVERAFFSGSAAAALLVGDRRPAA